MPLECTKLICSLIEDFNLKSTSWKKQLLHQRKLLKSNKEVAEGSLFDYRITQTTINSFQKFRNRL